MADIYIDRYIVCWANQNNCTLLVSLTENHSVSIPISKRVHPPHGALFINITLIMPINAASMSHQNHKSNQPKQPPTLPPLLTAFMA